MALGMGVLRKVGEEEEKMAKENANEVEEGGALEVARRLWMQDLRCANKSS